MAVTPKSQQEYYDLGKVEIQTRNDRLTDFTDGSILDICNGVPSVLAQELTRLLLDKFKTTFFASSDGDDLETLAVDHFGDAFARPGAAKAVGIVKFSRPDALAGDVSIEVGTIVKTLTDSNGNSQRFATIYKVTMTGLEINASVEAVEAGIAGNVDVDTVTQIETALTDPTITVNNDDSFAGGAAELTDAEYRNFIELKIQELRGATVDAIRSAALTVSGVEKATAIETYMTVIEWDNSAEEPIGEYFRIPNVKLYVADANGEANDALLALVRAAVDAERAAGVYIDILASVALELNWGAAISLNPSGPNYAEFQVDVTQLVNSMSDYISNLDIGADFNKSLADLAIMEIWGPDGTNDLVDFQTVTPSGNIVTAANEKLIPGTMSIV